MLTMRFESKLRCDRGTAWSWITSLDGISAEMRPFFRMTAPVGVRSLADAMAMYPAAFNELAKALTSTLESREVLGLVMQNVSSLLRPANWSLLLHDEATDTLYFEIAVGPVVNVPGDGVAMQRSLVEGSEDHHV